MSNAAKNVKEWWRRVRSYLPWRRESDQGNAVVVRPRAFRPAQVADPIAAALDRVFDPFFDPWRDLLPSALTSDWLAPVELGEEEDAYEVVVEVPGYSAKDLDVSLAGRTLTVRAERNERRGGLHREGRFYLTVPLPDEVDPDGVTAETRDGLLRVRVPKSAEARRRVRRIAVHG